MRPTGLPGWTPGADDYIAKPFSTKELLARVRAVLRRKAPEPAGRVAGNRRLVAGPSHLPRGVW